jgi:hypothetical protein
MLLTNEFRSLPCFEPSGADSRRFAADKPDGDCHFINPKPMRILFAYFATQFLSTPVTLMKFYGAFGANKESYSCVST